MGMKRIQPLVKGRVCETRLEAACEAERMRAASGVHALVVPMHTQHGLKYRIMWAHYAKDDQSA